MNNTDKKTNEHTELEKKEAPVRVKPKKDWYKMKSLSPMSSVVPFIMVTRNTSQNFIRDKFNTSAVDRYINEKRTQGYKSFGIMHVIIAAYIRAVSQRPGINRFIRGQRIYSRRIVEVVLNIKKEMTLESPDTVVKVEFFPDATPLEVYREFINAVDSYRKDPKSDFDSTARFLSYIPSLFMKFTVWFLKLLDYFGLLPRFLTRVSPFHGSFFITSMGSLGIPPIYHHLYDFGNVPVFCSFGAKYRQNELQLDGMVKSEHYIDMTFVTDERICDGFYFASALKLIKSYLKNPWILDTPPEKIIEDVK